MKKIFLSIITATLLLSSCSNLNKTLDRSIVPEAGPAPILNLGTYEQFELDNGLKVIVVENRKLPKVTYSINIEIPPILEGNKAGYVSMAGSLIESGTNDRSKSEIAEEVDFMGARLSTFSSGISGSSLKKHSETLLGIMSDVLLNPTFPEEELDKLKTRTLSGLANEESSADAISGRISSAMNYGLDHPYGEQETKSTVENITRDDLTGYYNTWFRPNIATLVIIGDIDREEAEIQANKYFGSWENAEVPSLTYDDPVPPSGNRVIFVPLPTAVQSVIRVSYPIEYSVSSEDYLAARVMNNILGGGGFYSRLNQNLREAHGYTYGAGSRLSGDQYTGLFSASASVRNEVTDSSVTQFMLELERMITEEIDDSIFHKVINNMNGRFALSLERPSTVAQFALNIQKYNLPLDYYDTYLDRLAALTKEEVQNAAKKYILPNNANIIIVGNKEEVAESLSDFAKSGEVEFYDMYGQPWQDRVDAPEGITEDIVLMNYISAIGGEEKINNLNYFTQSGSFSMVGMEFPMTLLYNGKHKMKTVISVEGIVMSENIINGDKGVLIQSGQTMALEGRDLIEARLQSDFLAETHYLDEYEITPTLLGIELFEDQEVYVIELTRLGQTITIDYYNVETGLKMKSESLSQTGMGLVTTTSIITEYKEYNGVLFPINIDVISGSQSYSINIDNINFEEEISDDEFIIE